MHASPTWTLLLALAALASCASTPDADEGPAAAPPPRSEGSILRAHLAYLDDVARAEERLAAGDRDGTAAAARAALRRDVAPWYDLDWFTGAPPGSHAAAHFLAACALADTDPEAAMDSLRAAARAGWSDTERVRTEPALAPLRGRGGWDAVLGGFRDEDATDALAGRTVVDRDDGMAVVVERAMNFPKLGEQAPDFELARADGNGTVRLADLAAEKPVVLVFGSYT